MHLKFEYPRPKRFLELVVSIERRGRHALPGLTLGPRAILLDSRSNSSRVVRKRFVRELFRGDVGSISSKVINGQAHTNTTMVIADWVAQFTKNLGH